MLMKLASYVVVFAVGAGGGIYWGVNHPSEAQSVHDVTQHDANVVTATVVRAKDKVVQKVAGEAAPAPADSAGR